MTNLTLEQNTLLILLKKSLWGGAYQLPEEINWEIVDKIAKEQAVISFAYDGAIAMEAKIPAEILQKWKRHMLHGVVNNERLLSAQGELLTKISEAGIPAVVLKGSSVAMYYPQPALRVLGDIDILIDESNLEQVRTIVERHDYVFHESDHEFHVGFSRQGVYVEIHYNVTKLPENEVGQKTQLIVDRFLDNIISGSVDQYVFPVLSEQNQAISLLLHMIRHMFDGGIGIRQLCDWAVYISKTDPDDFRNNTINILSQCGLLRYAQIATKACMLHLGLLDRGMEWCAGVSDIECQVFMEEVFRRGNMGDANKEQLGSLITDCDMMGSGQSYGKMLIRSLNKLAYKNFPVTERYRVLLPFAWIYMPIRYSIRSVLGLRPSKKVSDIISSANRQRVLYEMLEPFQNDQ